jgi:hypothetical protein
MIQDHLDLLLQAVADANRVLILPHNDPDPDAIASAVALGHILAEKLRLESSIAYRGIIGRAAPLRRSSSITIPGSQPTAWQPSRTSGPTRARPRPS